MNCLDEIFDKLKCMDKINSKIIMLDENHMYMNKCYKWIKYLDESSLVKISQNVTTSFATTRPNFILLVGLICLITCNSHQISHILKVLYDDIGVYFYNHIYDIYVYILCVCVYNKYAYLCIFFI
jgi:hypothetical protein